MTESQNHLIFYDFETTGLNPYSDDVIEYCFSKGDKTISSVVYTSKTQLVKEVVEITGITDDVIKQATPLMEHKDVILNILRPDNPIDKTFVVAHNNNRFDRFFLQRMLRDFGTNTEELNIYFIDTMDIAKCSMPFMRSISLKTLCKYFQFNEGTHRADSDVVALESVYYKLLIQLAKTANKNTMDLLKDPHLVYSIMYI